MRHILLSVFILCFLIAPAYTADQGVIVRQAKVYSEASSRKKSIANIAAGTTVNVFSRKGGWKEIYLDKQEVIGWVRSYQVREGLYNKPEIKQEAEADSRGFLSGLASFSRKASGFFGGSKTSAGSAGTATIGVRGLSEEEIKDAKPDLKELEKMQGYGSKKSRMAEFVSNGKLSSNKVKHLKKKK